LKKLLNRDFRRVFEQQNYCFINQVEEFLMDESIFVLFSKQRSGVEQEISILIGHTCSDNFENCQKN
jgi:hypothetical protein